MIDTLTLIISQQEGMVVDNTHRPTKSHDGGLHVICNRVTNIMQCVGITIQGLYTVLFTVRRTPVPDVSKRTTILKLAGIFYTYPRVSHLPFYVTVYFFTSRTIGYQ